MAFACVTVRLMLRNTRRTDRLQHLLHLRRPTRPVAMHLSVHSRSRRSLLLFRSDASPAHTRRLLLERTLAPFGHSLACGLRRRPEVLGHGHCCWSFHDPRSAQRVLSTSQHRLLAGLCQP